jgi:hypothetical protein
VKRGAAPVSTQPQTHTNPGKGRNRTSRQGKYGNEEGSQEKLPVLLLVTVLSQALLALVSGHLMTFSFFTAWHKLIF